MMSAFLWYKFKVLKNNMAKLVLALALIFILAGIQNLIDVEQKIFVSFLGLSYTLLLTYVLFTVDDLPRVSYFVASRKKISDLWKCNILYHVCLGYTVSFAFSIVYGLIFEMDKADLISGIFNSLLTVPFAAVFIGLSTVHFRNYTKKEIYLASIWAIINLLSPLLPIGVNYWSINLTPKFFLLISVGGTIGSIFLCALMEKQNTELLILNLKKEIGSYDRAILHLDED